MLKRLVVSLLTLAVLLVVADRVGLWAAQHDVAKRLQADAHLQATPKVEIHGFPFLTQLIGGDYHSVDIRMSDLHSGGLRITTLSVHLRNAHVSIGDVISQDRSRIRVDQATAHLLLRLADLPHSDVTSVSVSGGDTLVAHTKVGDFPLELTGLPFAIRLTSATITRAGIEVTGKANGLVVRS
jgi:hypothetical protein